MTIQPNRPLPPLRDVEVPVLTDEAERALKQGDRPGEQHARIAPQLAVALRHHRVSAGAPVVEREAAELGKPLAEHYTHLLVHGALHAQGWDHETSDEDADAMEAEEIRILHGLGVDNPYQPIPD